MHAAHRFVLWCKQVQGKRLHFGSAAALAALYSLLASLKSFVCLPFDCRELLGKHLHFEVLQGTSAIEEAAADEQPTAAASSSAGAAGAAAASTAAGAASKRPPAARWARQRPAVLLPWGSGMPQMPVQLRLDGELMQFRWGEAS